jgi:hypothetical protein
MLDWDHWMRRGILLPFYGASAAIRRFRICMRGSFLNVPCEDVPITTFQTSIYIWNTLLDGTPYPKCKEVCFPTGRNHPQLIPYNKWYQNFKVEEKGVFSFTFPVTVHPVIFDRDVLLSAEDPYQVPRQGAVSSLGTG